jgi:hypothetical protein
VFARIGFDGLVQEERLEVMLVISVAFQLAAEKS